VYCVAFDRGKRLWLVKYDNIKREDRTVAWPTWTELPSEAKPLSYDFALIFRERMWNDHRNDVFFTLSAGDDSSFLEVHNNNVEAPVEDDRVPMQYKGLIARPYVPRGWFVKLHDEQGDREPFVRNTVQEAVDTIIERGLAAIAEQAPPPPAVKVAPKNPVHVNRHRPGDL